MYNCVSKENENFIKQDILAFFGFDFEIELLKCVESSNNNPEEILEIVGDV